MRKYYSRYSRYRKPYKIKKRKSFLHNKNFWFFSFFSMIFGGIIYFLIFSSFFQVQAIEISGLQKIPQENLQNIIDKNIQKKILFFSLKNIFLADFGKISKEALNEFPQLETIKIKRRLPHVVTINAEEKKPTAILLFANRKFFIDKKGIIFEETKDDLSDLPILTIDGLSEKLNLGQEIIQEDRLAKIIFVNSKLKSDLAIDINNLENKLSYNFKIVSPEKLIVKTKEGWEFYLNIEGDIDWQITKLSVVLEEKIPPEKRRDLEYIELRFGNFAPYKYRVH